MFSKKLIFIGPWSSGYKTGVAVESKMPITTYRDKIVTEISELIIMLEKALTK